MAEREQESTADHLISVERKKIDQCAVDISRAAGRRLRSVIRIGKVKAVHHMKVEQPGRKAEVIANMEELFLAEGYPPGTGRAIASILHRASVVVENGIQAEGPQPKK